MKSLALGSDQLIARGLLILKPAEGAPGLLESGLEPPCTSQSPSTPYHTVSGGGSGVQDEVLSVLHPTEDGVTVPLKVVGARTTLKDKEI